jgi:hypothetical protein
MTLFVLACLLVIGAAFVLEATVPRGVLAVPIAVWLGVLGALGIWVFAAAG